MIYRNKFNNILIVKRFRGVFVCGSAEIKSVGSCLNKEYDELNKRHGLTRHDVWAVETPNGFMAVVLHEGPGADSFMHNVAVSDHPVDVSMRESIEKFHGMNLCGPPPGPMPEKLV